MNLRPARDPAPFDELRERYGLGDPTGPQAIDHILARGLDVVEAPRQAAAGASASCPSRAACGLRLSDHAPVVASFEVK